MSWLDAVFGTPAQIRVNGVLLPQERALNVIGTGGVTAVGGDAPALGQTSVTLSAAAAASAQVLASTGAIVFSGMSQPVDIVTTSGPVTGTVPTASDGQIMGPVLDRDGTWGAHAAALTVGPGVSIESPIGGAIVTGGTLILPTDPSVPRSSYSWVFKLSCLNPGPCWVLL